MNSQDANWKITSIFRLKTYIYTNAYVQYIHAYICFKQINIEDKSLVHVKLNISSVSQCAATTRRLPTHHQHLIISKI